MARRPPVVLGHGAWSGVARVDRRHPTPRRRRHRDGIRSRVVGPRTVARRIDPRGRHLRRRRPRPGDAVRRHLPHSQPRPQRHGDPRRAELHVDHIGPLRRGRRRDGRHDDRRSDRVLRQRQRGSQDRGQRAGHGQRHGRDARRFHPHRRRDLRSAPPRLPDPRRRVSRTATRTGDARFDRSTA